MANLRIVIFLCYNPPVMIYVRSSAHAIYTVWIVAGIPAGDPRNAPAANLL